MPTSMRTSSRIVGAFSKRDKFQVRQDRLQSQGRAAFRQLIASHFESRIIAQPVQIIAILMAAGNGEHALTDHVDKAVRDAVWIAFIIYAARQHVGKLQLPLKLAQHRHAAVRRQGTAIKTGDDFVFSKG